MTARQKFLVIRMTDPAGADGDPDIEEATRLLESHSTARIGRMYLVPASGQ